MIFSTDGGSTWTPNAALDNLMTGGGVYRSQIRRGAIDFSAFAPYPQPTLVAFDPADPNTIVAGAANAGVFFSRDGGATWSTMTNCSGGTNPVLPRPSFAHFARRGSAASIYIGTQGRGIWRWQYQVQPHPVPTAAAQQPNL